MYGTTEEGSEESRRLQASSRVYTLNANGWKPSAEPGCAGDPDSDQFRDKLIPDCKWTPRLGKSYMSSFFNSLFKIIESNKDNGYAFGTGQETDSDFQSWGVDHLPIEDGDRPARLEYLDHVPLIIEAPLNSVEIFEAVLKPSKPFPIYKAKHVTRKINKKASRGVYPFLYSGELFRFWNKTQAHLVEEGREIHYIVVTQEQLETLKEHTMGWPVKLWYISIHWQYTYRCRSVIHPYALVWNRRPEVDDTEKGTTYKDELARSLERLGLQGCKFERSLIEPGTKPLPENIYDYTYGIAGGPEAEPYFMQSESEVEARRQSIQAERDRRLADFLERSEMPDIDALPVPDGDMIEYIPRRKRYTGPLLEEIERKEIRRDQG